MANGEWRMANGESVSYTFPDDAFIDLNGVKIAIGGLTVDCYAGKFTADEMQFFSSVINKIPTQLPNVYPTDIVINDNDISGTGYPGRKDFQRYNIPYLSSNQFDALQEKVSGNHQHPEADALIKTINFFHEWAQDNCLNIKNKIKQIVEKNNEFPKQLSCLYDDREAKHTTHITLTYHAIDQCTVTIDSTVSPTLLFGRGYFNQLEQQGVNPATCKEIPSKLNPQFIELYKNPDDEKPTLALELTSNVNKMLLRLIYKRMGNMLFHTLGVPITNVIINHTYNQKNTDECVVFSIQNKLDFIQGHKQATQESALNLGSRFRAEHAVLSYLLEGAKQIPSLDEQLCQELNISYPVQAWYSNYPEVCQQLDNRIKQLSICDLEKLHLGLQVDDCLSLSPTFEDMLIKEIQERTNEASHIVIDPISLTQTTAELLQTVMSPVVIYKEESHSLFFSKKYANTQEGRNVIRSLQEAEDTDFHPNCHSL